MQGHTDIENKRKRERVGATEMVERGDRVQCLHLFGVRCRPGTNVVLGKIPQEITTNRFTDREEERQRQQKQKQQKK